MEVSRVLIAPCGGSGRCDVGDELSMVMVAFLWCVWRIWLGCQSFLLEGNQCHVHEALVAKMGHLKANSHVTKKAVVFIP